MLIAGGVPEKSVDFWGALQVVYVVFKNNKIRCGFI